MTDEQLDEMLKMLTAIQADLAAIRYQMRSTDRSLTNLERMTWEWPL